MKMKAETETDLTSGVCFRSAPSTAAVADAAVAAEAAASSLVVVMETQATGVSIITTMTCYCPLVTSDLLFQTPV